MQNIEDALTQEREGRKKEIDDLKNEEAIKRENLKKEIEGSITTKINTL